MLEFVLDFENPLTFIILKKEKFFAVRYFFIFQFAEDRVIEKISVVL